MSPPKLLDQVREAARLRHLSLRTEQAYVGWIRRFVLFHGKRHPREMGHHGEGKAPTPGPASGPSLTPAGAPDATCDRAS